jgi:hypothetical protein
MLLLSLLRTVSILSGGVDVLKKHLETAGRDSRAQQTSDSGQVSNALHIRLQSTGLAVDFTDFHRS